MAAFQYQAIDRNGKQKSGSITARDRSDALQQLSAAGLQTMTLGPVVETVVKPTNSDQSDNQPRIKASASRLAALNKIRLSGAQLILLDRNRGQTKYLRLKVQYQ